MEPELLTGKPMEEAPAGPDFSSNPWLSNSEPGEKNCDSEAESGRVNVLPGRLVQMALFLKVIDWPAGTPAGPKLSTARPSRLEKKPPDRVEAPLRLVCPPPLRVPFVQVNEP